MADANPVGARLAGEGVREIAIAGKPGSYGSGGCSRRMADAKPVGARLAGEGVREIAFAGKPGSYEEMSDAWVS
jgi:hypothetical protein